MQLISIVLQCDEGRPSCRTCVVRGETCHYTNELPSGCECINCECVSRQAEQNESESIVEFELTYHFARYTQDTLLVEPVNMQTKPLLEPPASLEYPYLLDACMAIAAAHLALLKPEQCHGYAAHAIHFQSRALARFREALRGTHTANEFVALEHFSETFTLLHIALSRVPGHNETRGSCVAALCEFRQLSRGTDSIRAMAKAAQPVQAEATDPTSIHEHVAHYGEEAEEEASDFRAALYLQIDRLEALLQREGAYEDQACYKQATQVLRKSSAYYKSSLAVMCIGFFVLVDDRYVELLTQRDAGARLIAGIYGLLLHGINDRWWARDLGRDLVEEVRSEHDEPEHVEMHNQYQIMLQMI